MSKIMNTIPFATHTPPFEPDVVPIFIPNQVLKDKDLNDIVIYLDSKNRLTRTYLIGMGIVCGLEVIPFKIENSKELYIYITPGCGITSEGFFVQHQPDIKTEITKNSFNGYQKVYLPNKLFGLADSPEQSFEARELIQTEDENTITIEELKEQVVLILCDWQEKERDTCTTDCDSLAHERKFEPRFFLIDKSHATKLLEKGFSGPLTTTLQGWFEVRDCQIQRLSYGRDLAEITTFEELLNAYEKVCQDGINQIDQSLQQIDKLFSPFFSSFHPEENSFDSFNSDFHNRLEALLPKNQTPETTPLQIGYGIQYFYDYLVELATAFNELKDALFDLMDDCLPPRERFPIYLLAGEVGEVITLAKDTTKIPSLPIEKAPPSIYRHSFYQPPIYNSNQKRKQEVRHLYERLVVMSKRTSFNLLPVKYTPIKITPSRHRKFSLGEQAIPFYYDYIQLYSYWNYDAYRKQKAKELPAYYGYKTESSQEPKNGYDLIHRFDWADFFRIEGHLGRSLDTILEKLEIFKKNFNLAFDIVPIRLGDGKDNPSVFKCYFDDLEKEFELIKNQWRKNPLRKQLDPPENHPITSEIVNCFDELFFSKQDLTEIKLASIENDFLNYAQDQENYQFQEYGDNKEKYRLVLKFPRSNPQDENDRIAVFTNQELTSGSQIDRTVDFDFIRSSFSADNQEGAAKIQKNKDGIIGQFVNCFLSNPTTLQVEKDPDDDTIYRMILRNGREPLEYVEGTEVPAGFPTSFLLQLEDETDYKTVDEQTGEEQLIERYQNFEALYTLLKFFSEQEHENEFDHAGIIFYYELRALFRRYLQRLEIVKKLQIFPGFVQENRGIEHLNGVPKGGTFILVYTEDKQIITRLKGQDIELQSNADKLVKKIKNDVYFPAEIKTDETGETKIDETGETKTDETEKELSGEATETTEESINYKMVIADFCLPYYCSSNNSINYVITPPRPLIKLTKSVFCEEDETIYDFILYPPGGLLKGGDGIVSHHGQYAFQPSQVDKDITEPTNITFFYIADGVKNSFSILMLPRVEIVLTGPKSFCVPAKNQEKNLITLRVKLSLEVDPLKGIFEVSTNEETIYQKIAHETIEVVENNTFDVSFDATIIPFADSQKRLTVYFKHTVPRTEDYCGNSSDPLPIILLRTPKAKIDYNKNNNNHKEVFGKLIHTSDDDCTQLAQEVQFYGSQADIYQWQLNGETLNNSNSRNLKILLPYTPKKSAKVTLNVANKYDDVEVNCVNLITIYVSLPELNPNWQFDPHSDSNTNLPTRTETSNTSEDSEIIVLCRHQYPENFITVEQPGGTFSSRPEGLIPQLVDSTLACSKQNKYVLDVSSDRFTNIFEVYTLTYTLPDDSKFSRLVEVIDLPSPQFDLEVTPELDSDPQQFEINISPDISDTLMGNIDPQAIDPGDILYQWDLKIGEQTITTHSNTVSKTLALNYDGGTYEEENHDSQDYDKIEAGELISVTLQVSDVKKICKKTFQPKADRVPLLVTRLELYQGSLRENNQVFWEYLGTIEDDANIPIADLGRVALKIQAVTFPDEVGSVEFTLDNPIVPQTTWDNLHPYEFYGGHHLVVILIILLVLIFLLLRNRGLDRMALLVMTTYYPQQLATMQVIGWWPQEGQFTLTVTPYQKANRQGYQRPSETVTFSLSSPPV